MAQRARKPKTQKASGLVVGLVLIGAASVALVWNEWRSASAVATLLAAERHVVGAALERVPVGDAGRLLHLAGPARVAAPTIDPLFGVGGLVLRLDRTVEMLQWREQSEGSGNDRTFRYERVWAAARIPSEQFTERRGRTNPPAPPFTSERFYPTDATLGAYGLGREVLDRLRPLDPVSPGSTALINVRGLELRATAGGFQTGTPEAPAIGDVRVRFGGVPQGDYSVLAGLDGSVLQPWRAPGGAPFLLVEPGLKTIAEMLGPPQRENRRTTWLVRFGGTLALFVGFTILLARLARMVPLLGGLASKFSAPIALTLAVTQALVLVAAGWLAFRPLFSLGLLVAGILLLLVLRWLRAGRPEDRLAPAGAAAPPGDSAD